jgi:hypothetical protein
VFTQEVHIRIVGNQTGSAQVMNSLLLYFKLVGNKLLLDPAFVDIRDTQLKLSVPGLLLLRSVIN